MQANYFSHSTRIIEGCGAIHQIGKEILNLGARRVLVITDKFLSQTTTCQKVLDSLRNAGIFYILNDTVQPNPRAEDCDRTAEIAKQENAEAIIGLGGGSAMDQAKATAALVTNGKKCIDWDDKPLAHPILPTVCIPTTAGTGSEITFVAVITDTVRKYKMSLFDPQKMSPVLAICDPEVTIGLPKSLTASCGIDALTHAIEAYTSKSAQPITDALAVHAIKLIGENLTNAFENGGDINARRNMMIASTMAGMAFINANVGAVHAIAETVGALFDIPHGVANAIFLPYVMTFNLDSCVLQYAAIARALQLPVAGFSEREAALYGISSIFTFRKRLSIPTLRQFPRISPNCFEEIAARSAKNPLTLENPKPMSASDYYTILDSAYKNEK